MNPSAMLAESLSEFSKAAYQAFSEVEGQSRMEVARASADIREAQMERDKAFKELHSCQLEVQSWKQEAAASKSALSQAELTIAHQTETLSVQLETIAQLRRELTQWKDQSRNWQEHFLRVEQERCAQSSRIDELVVERLQYPSSRVNSTVLFTPKAMKYTNGFTSAPSSTTKRHSIPSPTQPPEYKSTAPPSPSDPELLFDSSNAQVSANTQKRNKGTTKSQKLVPQQDREVPALHANGELEDDSSLAGRRPRKSNPSSHSAQKADPPSLVRPTNIIRRVQAVVHVKREDDSEDESPDTSAAGTSSAMKKKEESLDQQRYLRTPRPRIIPDDADDGMSDGSGSGSISDGDRGQTNINMHHIEEKGRFRQRSRINYREDEDEDEEDELMMGAEENHDEVYGTQKVETHDTRSSKKQPAIGPPPKKRKFTAR